MNKTIITLTGPSASGKSFLEQRLVAAGQKTFKRIVSTTTRAPRAGELDGREYHFVTPEQFKEIDASGELVESNQYGSNFYGATKTEFERAFADDGIAVIVVDPNGLRQIRDFAQGAGWKVVTVFVNASAKLKFERLVERFSQDFMASKDPAAAKAAFAARLETIYTIESTWGSEGPYHYDIFISGFCSANTEASLSEISALALEAQLGKYQPAAGYQVKPRKFSILR